MNGRRIWIHHDGLFFHFDPLVTVQCSGTNALVDPAQMKPLLTESAIHFHRMDGPFSPKKQRHLNTKSSIVGRNFIFVPKQLRVDCFV